MNENENENENEEGPFDLVSTDDVFNELANRFDHTLFIGMSVVKDGDENEGSIQLFHRRWEGNAMVLMGMAADVLLHIREDHQSHSHSEKDPSGE